MRFLYRCRIYLERAGYLSFAALSIILAGCSAKAAGPAARRLAPVDPWVLTCVDPSLDNPALLWNGLIGLRIGRDGTGSGPMFLHDEFDTDADEKVRILPNVLEGTWTAGPDSTRLDPKDAADYTQSLDMHDALLTTSWSQDIDGVKAKVRVETILDPVENNVAQRWTIDANAYLLLGFRAQPKGATSQVQSRNQATVEWKWPPSGTPIAERDGLGPDLRKPDPNADTSTPWAGNDNQIMVSAAADTGHPFVFTRFIEIADSPNEIPLRRLQSPRNIQTFIERAVSAYPGDFDRFVRDCRQRWDERWQTDIEIDGPVEDQRAVRSFLFYLRSGIRWNVDMVSPMGLSNDRYNGHVFWDADMYVFPALALIDPVIAGVIPSYRNELTTQAAKNFSDWLDSGRSTAAGKLGVPSLYGEAFGLKFPWESSISGKEVSPKTSRSRFEEHIGGDVAWMQSMATSLNLATPGVAKETIDGVASYYRWRSRKVGDYYEMPRVMSPDESHVGDNDLYTNLLAQWCQNGGSWANSKSHGVLYRLPHDQTSFLNYDNDALLGYRQTAALLAIYPLQYPEAEKEARTMMDRYAAKVADYGPAMSDSIHALIWARLGETDKAYAVWESSWRDFVKEPHLQFSEKRSKPVTYFTTGAAGCLQTVLYGFLGFRIDSKKQVGALWSTDLALGRILSVRPNLPNSWKSVKFKNFTVLGRRYTLIASRPDQGRGGGVQVIQGDR